ncbi:MAG: CDP-alcohol phosphatidyltransferase family protein, partial [Anaerolineales bacterium]|nr:CDP-alcohol phosphatidyltransferase family protein [Anaerolineales bacterium]
MNRAMTIEPTNTEKLKAWSVHAFTATGVVWGLLGVIAVMNDDWKLAFFWMFVATLVDGVDGMLARRFRVKGVLPSFDGALLDNIIDYFTYTV